MILGLLDPPSEVTVDFKNETVIHLTWLPPFSLKNITGYVITISAMESNNERIIDELQTTLSEFAQYTWRLSLGYCQNSFIFQIAAVNTLGVGSKTSGVVAGFLRCKLNSLSQWDLKIYIDINNNYTSMGLTKCGMRLCKIAYCIYTIDKGILCWDICVQNFNVPRYQQAIR